MLRAEAASLERAAAAAHRALAAHLRAPKLPRLPPCSERAIAEEVLLQAQMLTERALRRLAYVHGALDWP